MARNDRSGTSIVLFVGLVLGLAGAYWLLFLLHGRGALPFDPSGSFWGAARGYSPALAALITAGLLYGRSEIRQIGARLSRWRVAPRFYLLALLGPAAASVAMVVVVRLAGVAAQAPAEPPRPGRLLLIFFVFALIDGPLGEEIGWRGFLLPRLLERSGPIVGSVFLGLVWYLWHLVLYHAAGREMSGLFLASYLLNNVAYSFVHTWFFVRSGGSTFLSVVLHTAGNYFVFLPMALFPELAAAPEARATHLTLLTIAGLASAIALARRPGTPVEGAATDLAAAGS
jgi:CAAX protease family protein